VTAIATVAALILATLAVRGTWAQLRLARESEQRRQEAEERATQADLVAAWHDNLPTRDELMIPRSTPGAIVQNRSPLPVYEAKIEFYADAQPRAAVTKAVLPPREHPIPWPFELRQETGTDAFGNAIYTESPSEFAVALEFRDTAGQGWRRDRHGRLFKIGDADFAEGTLPAASSGAGKQAHRHQSRPHAEKEGPRSARLPVRHPPAAHRIQVAAVCRQHGSVSSRLVLPKAAAFLEPPRRWLQILRTLPLLHTERARMRHLLAALSSLRSCARGRAVEGAPNLVGSGA
jgi:hypothetical protein